ncbi:hypothetical protein, partial [Limosilactobacillus fermentum]|uniref:hypothetical protein n=1 Tax=Limosilactobacillus fermentum TaxID=1613 RepID=UPI001AEF5EF2
NALESNDNVSMSSITSFLLVILFTNKNNNRLWSRFQSLAQKKWTGLLVKTNPLFDFLSF